MAKQKKFYRPGTFVEKGTKISLKTRPIVNGVLFDMNDPISSFHSYLATIKCVINDYELLSQIPNIKDAIPGLSDISSVQIGYAKLLLDYLTQSPIEILLKPQEINQDIIATMEVLADETHE
jgi:hypothetical protein